MNEAGVRNKSAVLSVRAPAKLNLSLAVIARRPDGFHEIESLMVPITLHDILHVRPMETTGVRLTVSFKGRLARGPGRLLARDVPTDDRNLVVRGIHLLAERAGIEPQLSIELVKEIPSGAGLAGGSSDAAAAMMSAARIWGLDWPASRLASIAAEIGSDIPWFFGRSPGIIRGRGERVEPVGGIPPLPVVVVCPAGPLSTAAVYGHCVPEPEQAGVARTVADGLAAGAAQRSLSLLHNSLEKPARSLSSEVDQLLDAMTRAGAARPLLTGSGSGCFAICRTAVEARGIAARLEACGWPAVYCERLATVSRRARELAAG